VDEIIRQINTVIGAQPVSATTEKIVTKLTSFARRMCCAQSGQVVHYCCDRLSMADVPMEDVKFKVARLVSANVDFGKDTRDTERLVDHGISSTSLSSHETSLKGCSCQFVKCWELPCRHIFAILLALVSPGNCERLCEIVFNATVNHFWRSESELDLSRVALTSREAVRPTTIRSQKERETALNAASGAAIGFAKRSERGTNQLMNVLEEQVKKLSLEAGQESASRSRIIRAANPPEARRQTQVRKQPAGGAAPTTAANRAAGKSIEKQRNVANKAVQAKLKGGN
jgi:hypothetical protein